MIARVLSPTSTIVLIAVMLAACGAPVLAAPPYRGYTFCASGATGYLLDPDGAVLHTWQASGSAQTCAYLLEDGSALFPIQDYQCNSPQHNGAFPSGRFQKISWDGEIIWDYRFCDPTGRAGYDVEPMPNGNILIPTDGPGMARVFEVQPTGSTTGDVVWQCSLPPDLVGGNTYMNSVSYNPELDMILLDMQEPVRKVVVIDHSVPGGQVVLTHTVPGTGRVHAAIWVHRYFLGTDTEMPDADPAAMRLNNPLVVHNGGDRVVEFDWATGAMTAIPYNFQDHEGSAQRLPNGNTFVCRGGFSTLRELDDSGNVVASVTPPGSVMRAYQYGPNYGGLSQLWPAGIAGEWAAPASPEVRLVYDRVTETGNVWLANHEDALIAVRVFSVDGRMVRGESVWGRTAAFSAAGLASGTYYVQVRHAGTTYQTRFLKLP